MKHLTKSALAFCLLSLPALADTQEDVDYIVSQTVTRAMFEGALSAQRPLIIGALENQFRADGIVISDSEAFFDIFIDEWIDEFTASMQRQTGQIYFDLFSEKEIADIAGFYRTDSGQALIEQTPALMQAGAQLGQIAGQQAARSTNEAVANRLEQEGITIGDKSLTQKILDALR